VAKKKGLDSVKIYHDVICRARQCLFPEQGVVETVAKPLLRAWAFTPLPAFALGIAVLLFVLPSPSRAQAQSPAPSTGVQPQVQPLGTLPAGSAIRGKELFGPDPSPKWRTAVHDLPQHRRDILS